jgi:hypothetical protein
VRGEGPVKDLLEFEFSVRADPNEGAVGGHGEDAFVFESGHVEAEDAGIVGSGEVDDVGVKEDAFAL